MATNPTHLGTEGRGMRAAPWVPGSPKLQPPTVYRRFLGPCMNHGGKGMFTSKLRYRSPQKHPLTAGGQVSQIPGFCLGRDDLHIYSLIWAWQVLTFYVHSLFNPHNKPIKSDCYYLHFTDKQRHGEAKRARQCGSYPLSLLPSHSV